MNDLLSDFMQADAASPSPHNGHDPSPHHHRAQSAFDAPQPSVSNEQAGHRHRWSESGRTGSADPVIETQIRRTTSDKKSKISFLEKYRADRAARKSRASRDLGAEPTYIPSTIPNGKGIPKIVPGPNGKIVPPKGAVAVTLDQLNPQLLQQLIAESTEPFLQDTTEIKELLAEVKAEQLKVDRQHNECKLLTTAAEIKAGRARCQESIEEVTRTVKRVRDQLTSLEELNSEIVTQARAQGMQDLPEIHMRVAVMAGLSAKLHDLVSSWATMRSRWAQEERQEVGRQLYTVTGQQFDDDQLQEVVDSGGQDRIYQQALMAPGQQRDIKAMLGQIEQRHSEMQALEAAMLDLHQVFLDMSIVVYEQGEQLDRIEQWVQNTQTQMRLGLEQLLEAKKHRRAAAQKKAITFVTGVGLVAGGVAIAASGPGAIVGIPMAVIGAGVVGISAL